MKSGMKTEELVKPLEIREDDELDENKDKAHLGLHWGDKVPEETDPSSPLCQRVACHGIEPKKRS